MYISTNYVKIFLQMVNSVWLNVINLIVFTWWVLDQKPLILVQIRLCLDLHVSPLLHQNKSVTEAKICSLFK